VRLCVILIRVCVCHGTYTHGGQQYFSIFRMNIFRTGIQRVLCCKSKITHLKWVIITEISKEVENNIIERLEKPEMS
jgi:hypothetical protein